MMTVQKKCQELHSVTHHILQHKLRAPAECTVEQNHDENWTGVYEPDPADTDTIWQTQVSNS